MTPRVPVGELAIQVRGVTYKAAEASKTPQSGTVAVVRAGNIVDGELTNDDLVYVPASRVAEKQWLKKGDVLIATSSGSLDVVGKAARVRRDEQLAFGAFCKVLRPTPRVDAGYFAHYFQTTPYRRHVERVAEGANINNLRNDDLANIQISLPPKEEQRRIAAVLDAADALRAKRRQTIAMLNELTQSIFHDMFGDGTSGHTAKLGDVVPTTSGGTPSRSRADFFEGHIPWVKSGELGSESVTATEEVITEEALSSSSAKLMPPGTVLVAMYGATVGAVALLEIEAATNQAVCCLTPTETVSGTYLLGFLRSRKRDLIRRAAGGAQPNISQTIIRGLDIPLVPVDDQREYARRIAAVERLRDSIRCSAAELDTLFAALQQRAFRGEL